MNEHTTAMKTFEFDALPHGVSKCFDDDGRPKRTGTVWTTSAHIMMALIGSGVLSLAWATAQLGWVAGPTVICLFSFVTYYTSCLLSECYRSGDPATGRRNYTYMEAVQANLGVYNVKICGFIQLFYLFGLVIGYTIAASNSMMAINRADCFHESHSHNPCQVSSNPYKLIFGFTQILFSQLPDFDQIYWLSMVAPVMSFTYSSIGLGLGVAKVVEYKKIMGSMTGISIGKVTQAQKMWGTFQALGGILFAYAYSLTLIEIQDKVKSPPAEYKTMKKATLISVALTTVFYMLCGCFGYAAFGDLAPGNLLTGFGFYNPFWLLDIANVAIVIHLVCAYHAYCQQLFAFVEKSANVYFPQSQFINKEYAIPLPGGFKPYKLNLFRLVWRTIFVIITTVISMITPLLNDVVILGALGFWPLTVYFPVEMYIVQKKIPKWSCRWISLQMLSVACLIISLSAAAGAIAGVVIGIQVYKPFKTTN